MFVFVEGLFIRLSLLLYSLIYHHLLLDRFLTMADQDQAQSNNTDQTESTPSSKTKSTSKKSKNKPATTPKTDVPDGNSSTTTDNNVIEKSF
jgi:hypothetical protein